ncbi:Sigma factor binding protein 2 [Spatholobus suberectus]|nr:Sigma factor binding protein 2 [Spatholobus suberectus]
MKNKRASGRDKKEIKVTYISSPVKVKTSASNFRALVQELTGQYSNVAETMPMEEENGHSEGLHKIHESENQQWRVDVAQGYLPEDTNSMRSEYSKFLSRPSLMEPYQQHLQYDLMSFDMS